MENCLAPSKKYRLTLNLEEMRKEKLKCLVKIAWHQATVHVHAAFHMNV